MFARPCAQGSECYTSLLDYYTSFSGNECGSLVCWILGTRSSAVHCKSHPARFAGLVGWILEMTLRNFRGGWIGPLRLLSLALKDEARAGEGALIFLLLVKTSG